MKTNPDNGEGQYYWPQLERRKDVEDYCFAPYVLLHEITKTTEQISRIFLQVSKWLEEDEIEDIVEHSKSISKIHRIVLMFKEFNEHISKTRI